MISKDFKNFVWKFGLHLTSNKKGKSNNSSIHYSTTSKTAHLKQHKTKF